MMIKKNIKFIIFGFAVLLLGAGCSMSPTTRSGDGGVWLSTDKGETWQSRSFVREDDGKLIGIDSLNVTKLKSHRRDSRIIYAGTNKGIYFTENAGERWESISDFGEVNDLALDPEVRGILYAVAERSIFKTTDNGRSWELRYLEPREKTFMTDIIVDPSDNGTIYAGTNTGDVITSNDFGKSWRVLSNFKDSIREILVNPKDRSILYVGTRGKGIQASFDRGETWQNLLEFYSDFRSAKIFHQLAFDPTGKSSLLYASGFGLLKSDDGGFTWREIPTVSPPGTVIYRSLTVNPGSEKEIYYATDQTLNRSFDGGANWISSSLPTSRTAGALMVDFFDTTKIYLGANKAK